MYYPNKWNKTTDSDVWRLIIDLKQKGRVLFTTVMVDYR